MIPYFKKHRITHSRMTKYEDTLTFEDIQHLRVYLNDREFKRFLSMYYPVGDIWKRLPPKNTLPPIIADTPRIPRLRPFRLPKIIPRFI